MLQILISAEGIFSLHSFVPWAIGIDNGLLMFFKKKKKKCAGRVNNCFPCPHILIFSTEWHDSFANAVLPELVYALK